MDTKELLKKTIEDRIEAVKAQDEGLITYLDQSIEQIKELIKLEEKYEATEKKKLTGDQISDLEKLKFSVLSEKEWGSACIRCSLSAYNKLKEYNAAFNFSTSESISLIIRFFEERMNI